MLNSICLARCAKTLSLALVTCVTAIGCTGGEPADDRPDRTPVSGVVTYNGEPVEGALVTFTPSELTGSGANGRTDADGRFEMGTYEASDGVRPGSYQVSISKVPVVIGDQPSEDDPNYDPNASTEPEAENVLPAKYADWSTSGFTAEVGNDAITDLKFDLTD
ncbi:MAG: carboxypeptidase-like regulatory domain-containing protein [Maioricimonas sp. JB045]|uniref:carboxypeptidase-like regulatory domain-containing protein n=1 Tax=Maioricimonas sp. JC845 TaxID=3232138 RepID=UPI00345AFAFE